MAQEAWLVALLLASVLVPRALCERVGERCDPRLPHVTIANPSFEADEHGQDYNYTTPEGWIAGEHGDLGPTGRVGVIVCRNGNRPWGGLDSHAGNYFLALQRTNSSVSQTLRGLVANQQYILTFKSAERPGYGDDEKLSVIIDGMPVVNELDPFGNGFHTHHVEFMAVGPTATIEFINKGPPDVDSSVFIDDIDICPVAHGCTVLSNGGFEDDAHGQDYLYQHPNNWVGVQRGSVVAANNNAPWGRLDSGDGAYYLVLQSRGAGVQQQLPQLIPGATYSLQFLAAERPGYGEDERLTVYVNNLPLEGGDGIDVGDNFTEYALTFTAASRNLLFFENTSPGGVDRSVFVDAVQICTAPDAAPKSGSTSASGSTQIDIVNTGSGLPVWPLIVLAVIIVGLVGFVFRNRIPTFASKRSAATYSIVSDDVEMDNHAGLDDDDDLVTGEE